MKAVLMVNSACNNRCEHCYLQYSGSRTPKDTLDTVKQLQGEGLEVVIAGSETLLDLGYLESYKQTGQRYILSNGVILHQDKSIYKKLEDTGIELIQLSIQSGMEDRLKSVPEMIVAGVLREAREHGFKTQVNTTITSENYSHVKEMCDAAKAYGASKIKFLKFAAVGRAKDMTQLEPTEGQVTEFFRLIDESRKSYSKSELEIRPYGNFGPRLGTKGEQLARENRYCPAGVESVAIAPDNLVYACVIMMDKKDAIGRYENGKIIIDKNLFGGRRDKCLLQLIDRK